MERPNTEYARSGDIHIAYQVVGEGPLDLVYLSSWDLGIDFHWDEPNQVRFFERLASFSRLILFDKRGTGASDSVSLVAMPTLESWVDDVQTIMDCVGSERAAIMATTFSGPLACLVAASLPQRTSALVLLDTFARFRAAENYPGMDDEDTDVGLEGLGDNWGSGYGLEFYAPSIANDMRLRRWWGRCQRLTISPATAAAFTRMMVDSDVRHVLPAIQAPTLVVNRPGPIGDSGRYLAEHIPVAKLVTAQGADLLPWFGDRLPEDIEEFLTGTRPAPSEPDRAFATLLFTDIVSSTARTAEVGDHRWREVMDEHDDLVQRELGRFRGRLVNRTGDGLLAAFDGPARAIRCASEIATRLRDVGIEIRAGLHAGEVEARGDDVTGIAVNIANRVSSLARDGEVLVSRTVSDLVAGSGLTFEDRGEHELKGVPGRWQLYAVKS